MAALRLGPTLRVPPRWSHKGATELCVYHEDTVPTHPVCIQLFMGESTAHVELTPDALNELTDQLIAARELTRGRTDQHVLSLGDDAGHCPENAGGTQ